MNKKNAFLILAIVIPALLGLLYVLYSSSNKKNINWQETYKSNNKEPFGVEVIYELLKNYNKAGIEDLKGSLHQSLPSKEKSSNYVFIGSSLFLSRPDLDTLLKYIKNGNTAFISAKAFPYDLMNEISGNTCEETDEYFTYKDSIVVINFNHPDLTKEGGYVFKTPHKANSPQRVYNWMVISNNYFCNSTEKIIKLGYISDKSGYNLENFIEIPYGKGKFLFHTTPIVLTNYYLKQKEGFEYASKVLSHLNQGKIYWDEISKLPSYEDESESMGKSPLRLILEDPSLRFAWYLLLVLIILYIIFFAKRKQRAIQILEPNINTSLEFVKTVGTLYFQQNNHRKLMHLKLKLFLSFIRHKYMLPTNKINEDLMKKLSLKSNIPYENIHSIFKEINVTNRYDIKMNADDVIRLHNALDFFYKNCK